MRVRKILSVFLLTVAAFAVNQKAFAQKGELTTGGTIKGNAPVVESETTGAAARVLDPTQGIVVDDDSQCPGTDFQTIQAAVNAAAPGTLIQVCPGTYQEQVAISKRLTIVGVEYQNASQAIIKPAPATPNASSLFSGSPIAAIVLVNDVNNVSLDNLTIDGATNGISGCNTAAIVGVFWRNASGTAENLAVKNIRAVGNGSCQNNFGIFVQSGGTGTSRVSILNSSVHDYEKAGIVANERGTNVTLTGNTVNGSGPISTNVQNGIQVGFGAQGTVSQNFVINHISATCTTIENCENNGGGGIISVEANAINILSNNVGKNQAGIFVIGNRSIVTGNTLTDTDVADGITIVGNRNEVRDNRIFNSDRAGVLVSGNRNIVRNNTINEAVNGILQDATASTGNTFTENRFFNTNKQTTDATNLRPQARGTSSAQGISVVRF